MGKQIRLIAGLAVTLQLAACAGATQNLISAPTVNLSSVQLSRMSFSGQTFLLGFDVSNPNPFPLPVKSIRYSLQLDEHRFASGETRGDFDVPASGNGSFSISVELDVLQQSSQIGSLLRSGMRENIAYDLQGSLAIDIPLTGPIPFSNSGTIQVANAL